MGYITFTVYDATTKNPIQGALVAYTLTWSGHSPTTTQLTDGYGNATFNVNGTPFGAPAYGESVKVSANGYITYSSDLKPWTGNGSLSYTINLYPNSSPPKEPSPPPSSQTYGFIEWAIILGILVTIIIVFLYLRSRKPKGPQVPQNITYKTYHMQ